MNVDDQNKSKGSMGKSGRWIAAGALVVAFLVSWQAHFPPVVFALWGLGEIVIPAWEAVDPTAPRPPIPPNDMPELKDADSRGKALRAEIDKYYVSLPETRKSLLREFLAPPYVGAAGLDVSNLIRHYIPAGTSFDEAERILRAAGLTIVKLRVADSERPLPPPGKPLPDYDVEAAFEGRVEQPAGFKRLYVWMSPQNPGAYRDSSPVGTVKAFLFKQLAGAVPPVFFPFDASSATTVVDEWIKIVEEGGYLVELVFRPAGPTDIDRVRGLIGEAHRYADGRYSEPGVVVPIHVVVTNESQQTVYDRVVDSQGIYSFGYLEFFRRVAGVELRPGLYRIRASTTKAIPEFAGTKIEFGITSSRRF